MADRLSPNASSLYQFSRVGGFNLTIGVAISDPRGNRRRSVGSCRARPMSFKELSV